MTERDYKKDYEDLFRSDAVQRRERIAMAILNRNGFWDAKTASSMEEWIEGSTNSKHPIEFGQPGYAAQIRKGAPFGNPVFSTPVVKKRKYTKKSKRWKKKSAKKSA